MKKAKISDENNNRLPKNQILKSNYIYITIFEPQSKRLKPIFENFSFLQFLMLNQRNNRSHPLTQLIQIFIILDEIRFLFREKLL